MYDYLLSVCRPLCASQPVSLCVCAVLSTCCISEISMWDTPGPFEQIFLSSSSTSPCNVHCFWLLATGDVRGGRGRVGVVPRVSFTSCRRQQLLLAKACHPQDNYAGKVLVACAVAAPRRTISLTTGPLCLSIVLRRRRLSLIASEPITAEVRAVDPSLSPCADQED